MPSEPPPTAGSKADTAKTADTSRMSIGDHLDELRKSLIRAMVGVVLGMIVGFTFGKEILGLICKPLLVVQVANGLQPSAQVLAPSATFLAYMKVGILTGLILAAPWIIYQIWTFVAAGLYRQERRFVTAILPGSFGLFALGVAFLYFLVLPVVLNFFISFNKSFPLPTLTPMSFQRLLLPTPEEAAEADATVGSLQIPVRPEDPKSPKPGEAWINASTRRLVVNTPDGLYSTPMERGASAPIMKSQFAIDHYVSFVLMMALAFGIAFETPIVVYFLARTGIVSTEAMRRGRKYVLFAMVFLAAVLTPPDIISQLLLAGPMYLLFELGLLLARVRGRSAK